jgi:hypothetical protein
MAVSLECSNMAVTKLLGHKTLRVLIQCRGGKSIFQKSKSTPMLTASFIFVKLNFSIGSQFVGATMAKVRYLKLGITYP